MELTSTMAERVARSDASAASGPSEGACYGNDTAPACQWALRPGAIGTGGGPGRTSESKVPKWSRPGLGERNQTQCIRRLLARYVQEVACIGGVLAVRTLTREGRVVVETITEEWDAVRDGRIDGVERTLRRTYVHGGLGTEFRIVPAAALDGAPIQHGGVEVLYTSPEV